MAKKSRLYGDWKSVGPKLKVIGDKIPETMVDEVKKTGKDYVNQYEFHGYFPFYWLIKKNIFSNGSEKGRGH